MCGIAIEIFVCNGQFNPTGLGSYQKQYQCFLKYLISRVNKEIYCKKNNKCNVMFMTTMKRMILTRFLGRLTLYTNDSSEEVNKKAGWQLYYMFHWIVLAFWPPPTPLLYFASKISTRVIRVPSTRIRASSLTTLYQVIVIDKTFLFRLFNCLILFSGFRNTVKVQ